MLRLESVGLAACKMGTGKAINAGDSVRMLEPDEVIAIRRLARAYHVLLPRLLSEQVELRPQTNE